MDQTLTLEEFERRSIADILQDVVEHHAMVTILNCLIQRHFTFASDVFKTGVK